jgi:hypothetical protein
MRVVDEFRSRIIDLRNTAISGSHILVAAVSAWIASVMLTVAPTVGLTARIYPPKPNPGYQLILLLLTGAFASIYSFVIGVKMFRAPEAEHASNGLRE